MNRTTLGLLAVLALTPACLDDEVGTVDDQACAEIVREYEVLYADRFTDHKHRDFDRILEKARPYMEEGNPSCRTLQGIHDAILTDRGQAPKRNPLDQLSAGRIGLLVIGFLFMLVAMGAQLWLYVLAFQESVLWGIGSIMVPFVSLVFAIMFWDVTKKPFLISLGSSFVGGLFFAAMAL
ncbi:MAG: hypothetical protein RIT81_09105 [Deltaproteobacteria bacterium]